MVVMRARSMVLTCSRTVGGLPVAAWGMGGMEGAGVRLGLRERMAVEGEGAASVHIRKSYNKYHIGLI